LLAFWVSDPSIVPWIGSKVSAVAAAAFTYSYMTLDALDGKHARNTKQSSALQLARPVSAA
jgi:phosphatidylglycerophosphate synthase